MNYNKDELQFMDGAKKMLQWIDKAMQDSGSAGRVYEIRTFKIRQVLKHIEDRESLLFKDIL